MRQMRPNPELKDGILRRNNAILRNLDTVRVNIRALVQAEKELITDLADCRRAARLFEVELPDNPPINEERKNCAPVREFLLEQLKSNDGITARDMNRVAASRGMVLHEKTIGMTLYRLKLEGSAYRDGSRIWRSITELRGVDTNPSQLSPNTGADDSTEGKGADT